VPDDCGSRLLPIKDGLDYGPVGQAGKLGTGEVFVVITMLVIRASAGVAAPISESSANATAQLG